MGVDERNRAVCCWNVSYRPRMSLSNEYKRDISVVRLGVSGISYSISTLVSLRGLSLSSLTWITLGNILTAPPPPVIRGVSRLFYHSSSSLPLVSLLSKLSYEREYGGSCRYSSSALYSWLVRSIGCTRWWWWWWSLNDRRGTWFMRSTGTVLSFY